MYIALTGDIRSSSRVEDRRDLAKRLLELCEQLNKHFAPFILAAFKVVSGDGIQGLLKLDTNLMKLSFYIRAVIHPYFMRLGFGIGGIDTDMEADVSKMDGECFRNSAQAVESSKSLHRWACVKSIESSFDMLFNISLQMYDSYMSNKRDRQKQIINQYVMLWNENKALTQSMTGKILNIPQSNISRTLKKIGWNTLKFDIDNLPNYRQLLQHYAI